MVPKCLEWYPDRMAWQINLTRKEIRRVEAYFRYMWVQMSDGIFALMTVEDNM